MRLLAAQRDERRLLLAGFDPLSHDPEPRRVCQAHRGGDDRGPLTVDAEATYELPVHLERVERETGEMGKGGITRSEIVDGEAYPERAQRGERAERPLRSGHNRSLGDFHYQAPGLQTAVLKRPREGGGKPRRPELAGPHIYRDGDIPCCCFCAGHADDVHPNLGQQPSAIRCRKKRRRG